MEGEGGITALEEVEVAAKADVPVLEADIAVDEAPVSNNQQEQEFQEPLDSLAAVGDAAGEFALAALSSGPPPGQSFTGAGAIPGAPDSRLGA